MRLSLISFLSFFTITISLGEDVLRDKTLDSSIENERTISPIKERSSARTISRNSYFQSFKIDSSKNGYGAFTEINSPLAYSYDANGDGENAGWVAVYRQFGTLNETAGFLGVAQSDPYGEEWYVESRINTTYPENQQYSWDPDGNNGNGLASGLPTPDGAPGARYPSAVISSYQNKATAVWNEYTLATYGGGNYGGVPMYSYDFFPLGENSNFSAIQHINEGCINLNLAQGEVCDPPDLWQANVQLIDGTDGMSRLLSMYTSWADGEGYSKYMIRSLNITNGYISVDAPAYVQQDSLDSDDQGNCLWYECGGYTGTPDFHINNDGIGYMGMTSWSFDSDTEPPFLHTIFFKYTEDYGETWSSEGGLKNSGYYYLPDEEVIELQDSLLTMWSLNPEKYPDKPWYPWAVDSLGNIVGDTISYSNDSANFFWTPAQFLHYTYDMMTDENGGLHFVVVNYPWLCKDLNGGCDDNDGDGIADSVYWENRFGGAGMMHYYNPNPVENPRGWKATFIEDFSDAYSADWPTTGPMLLYTDPIFYFTPNIRPSYEEGSEVIWYASSNLSRASYNADSTLYVPSDIDIFMAKSVDNGKSWTEPENVTNTAGGADNPQVEYGVHLANIGSDNEIGIFYQMPVFDTNNDGVLDPTTGEQGGYYDYMNHVYVGKYENDLESLSTIKGNEKDIIPNNFVLRQNYPNPFNPITKISYSIDKASDVKLFLYDVRGGFVQDLINKRVGAGNHDFMLDATHLSSGVYFYTMTVDNVSQTRKLILMK